MRIATNQNNYLQNTQASNKKINFGSNLELINLSKSKIYDTNFLNELAQIVKPIGNPEDKIQIIDTLKYDDFYSEAYRNIKLKYCPNKSGFISSSRSNPSAEFQTGVVGRNENTNPDALTSHGRFTAWTEKSFKQEMQETFELLKGLIIKSKDNM